MSPPTGRLMFLETLSPRVLLVMTPYLARPASLATLTPRSDRTARRRPAQRRRLPLTRRANQSLPFSTGRCSSTSCGDSCWRSDQKFKRGQSGCAAEYASLGDRPPSLPRIAVSVGHRDQRHDDQRDPFHDTLVLKEKRSPSGKSRKYIPEMEMQKNKSLMVEHIPYEADMLNGTYEQFLKKR